MPCWKFAFVATTHLHTYGFINVFVVIFSNSSLFSYCRVITVAASDGMPAIFQHVTHTQCSTAGWLLISCGLCRASGINFICGWLVDVLLVLLVMFVIKGLIMCLCYPWKFCLISLKYAFICFTCMFFMFVCFVIEILTFIIYILCSILLAHIHIFSLFFS